MRTYVFNVVEANDKHGEPGAGEVHELTNMESTVFEVDAEHRFVIDAHLTDDGRLELTAREGAVHVLPRSSNSVLIEVVPRY